MPKFTVKAWRKVRPESAKDTGVAGAIGEIDKAFAKKVALMSGAEVQTAKTALDNLGKALDKGKQAVDGDAKGKDRTAARDLIDDWKKEIKTLLAELALGAAYDVKVAAVQAEYDKQYQRIKGDVDTYHADAAGHNHSGTRPPDVQLQRYLVAIRDGSNICSKQSIQKVLAEAKSVKVESMTLPGDVKATKTKIDQLMTWSTAFAKQGKTDAKGRAAALDDTVAADKAVKKVMDAYKLVEGEMKTLIAETKRHANMAKQLADQIKALIGAGNTDSRVFTQLVKAIKVVSGALEQCDADLRRIGDGWRTSSSPTGKMVSACRSVPGFSEATHGKLMIDRMQANQMLIRQVSIPYGDGNRQIERAKRLLDESTSHRGFAAAL